MSEKRLNTEELAKALGVNKMTIYRDLKRDDCAIPYNRIGRNNYFLLSEVLQATKVTPVDKKEVIEKLNELINNKKCVFIPSVCLSEGITEIIRFIEGSP